ncbi:MAG: UDP-N-acetylmuramoyl-tripeptide--D-alanyl-D-alanine ligase [Microlunatus sp.]
MIPVTVRELAALLDAELVGPDGLLDEVVTGLVVDSREVVAGSLFLALPGERVDGHDYVVGAFARGAAAALTSRPVDGAAGPCLVVPDPLLAAGRIARDQVDRATEGGMRTAALTGSVGKTSTKDLLAQVLEAANPTVAPVGNLNNELGLPLTVCRIEPDTRFLVAEMGARGIGHIAYLCGIAPPQVAAVLNVGTAHVGEFGGQQQIATAKGEIVEALPADGTAVLNADDRLVWAMRARTTARVVATSALGEPSWPDAVWAEAIVADALGRCAFTLHQKSAAGSAVDPVRIQLGVSGHHQVPNAIAAVAMARALGVDHEIVVDALSAAGPRSRWRMELTERADGVLIVNDAYNANPQSMHAALDTVEEILAGRNAAEPTGAGGVRGWAVLGDMLELGDSATAEHRALGSYAIEHGITRLVAVGSFADEIVAGALAAGAQIARAASPADSDVAVGAASATSVGGDCHAAARLVADGLEPGDVVLVKASRGLALDTVAAALAVADPVGRDDQHGRDDASGHDQPDLAEDSGGTA